MTPTAPRTLSPSARRLWRAIYRDAPEAQLANPVWLQWLEVHCSAFDRFSAAAAVVQTEGITKRDARGVLRRHPALRELANAKLAMLRAYDLCKLGEHRRQDRRRTRVGP